MKTLNFFPTLLALIIRVIVSGQPCGQSKFPFLKMAANGRSQSSPSTTIAKQRGLKQKSEAVCNDRSAFPFTTYKKPDDPGFFYC